MDIELKLLRGALDDAWAALRPDERARASKSMLAVRLLEVAAAQRGTEHRGDVGSLSYAGVQVDALRRAKKLHITSTMMAPTTAPIRPAPSSARYQPSAWPR